jgi:hypothetical protein
MFSHSSSEDNSRKPIVLSILLLVPLVAFAMKLKSTVLDHPRQELLKVPLQAVEYLKESKITGNTFTDPNIWGGYVIWALPSNPVYIDGRIDMYGDQFVKEYLEVIWGLADWREPFDRYRVGIVIIAPKSSLARELGESRDWLKVFQDDMSVVFTRH